MLVCGPMAKMVEVLGRTDEDVESKGWLSVDTTVVVSKALVVAACTEVCIASSDVNSGPIELELLGEFLGSGCRSGCTTVIPLN